MPNVTMDGGAIPIPFLELPQIEYCVAQRAGQFAVALQANGEQHPPMRSFGRGLLTGVAGLALLISLPAHADVSINILGFRYESSTVQSPTLELTIESQEPVLSGKWSARLSPNRPAANQQVWFSIGIRERGSTRAFSGLADTNNYAFLFSSKKTWRGQHQVITPTGNLLLHGEFSKKTAEGSFRFDADTNYLTQATAHLSAPPSPVELLELGLSEATVEHIAEFANLGLKCSAADILRLRGSGVTPQYAAAVRKARPFSATEIARLRSSGVVETFPASLQGAGYDLNIEEIIKLRHSGVSVEEAAAWKKGGFNWLPEDLVKLRNAGVKAEFGAAVKEIFPGISTADLIKLRHSGVTKEYLAGMNKTAPRFSVEEIIKLRNNGVTADYIVGWQKAGFNLSADELIKLRNNGVPSDYAAALNVPNRKPLAVETLIKLRHRGLTAQEIRELRE